MYIWLTIHIATMIYQYMSYLCYGNIHLLRFISFNCTLLYNKYIILLCSICNHHKPLLISQVIITKFAHLENIESIPLCCFQIQFFCCRQLNLPPSKSFDFPYAPYIEASPHKAYIERWSSIMCWFIMMR